MTNAGLAGIHTVNLFRKAVKDVTLSDGTRIPRGTLVAAASVTAHRDDARYGGGIDGEGGAASDVFDPFRFSRMRETGEVEDAVKHQLVNTSVDFITFGHGRHAWCVPSFPSLPPSSPLSP